MKVLITGGSGFVGRNLCRLAESSGWEVTTLSRHPAPHGRWIRADLSRPFELNELFDVVVHAAARSSPWGSAAEYRAQNTHATRHVLDYCERAGRPHVIYISTSAVLYRNQHQFGMTEEEPVPETFLNEYARTKYEGENMVRRYGGTSAILRPRAVFGEGDTVVFPRILRAARQGKFPILESDTAVMADLIHIEVLCRYILRAMETQYQGLFHLSNNEPVPIVPFLLGLFERLGLPKPSRKIPVARAMRAAAVMESVYRTLPFLGEPPITRFGVSVFAYSKTMNVTRSIRFFGLPALTLREGVDRFVHWQRQTLG